jgi:hypothetical protein
MYFKVQKFTSQNLLNQTAVFCVRNVLKVIYTSIRDLKIFSGVVPRTPVKRGREDMGREGRDQWCPFVSI